MLSQNIPRKLKIIVDLAYRLINRSGSDNNPTRTVSAHPSNVVTIMEMIYS